jgi:hypothetical protein
MQDYNMMDEDEEEEEEEEKEKEGDELSPFIPFRLTRGKHPHFLRKAHNLESMLDVSQVFV